MREKALHFDIAQFERDLQTAREDVGDQITVHFDGQGMWNNQILPVGHPRQHFAIREDRIGFIWENGTFERLSSKHTLPVEIHGLSQSEKETGVVPKSDVAFSGYVRGQSGNEGVVFILQATDYIEVYTEALANLVAPFMFQGFPTVTAQLDYTVSRVTVHRVETPSDFVGDYPYEIAITRIDGSTVTFTATTVELSRNLDNVLGGEWLRSLAEPTSYRMLALQAQHEIRTKQHEIELLEKGRNRFLACAHGEGVTKYRLAHDLGASEPSIDRWITKDTRGN